MSISITCAEFVKPSPVSILGIFILGVWDISTDLRGPLKSLIGGKVVADLCDVIYAFAGDLARDRC